MSDEPLAPEPILDRSPLRGRLLTGGLSFLGGVALTAGLIEIAGPRLHPAAGDAATPPTSLAPAAPAQPGMAAPGGRPALPPASDIATLNAREVALAGRLDALEQQIETAGASAHNAAGYATQAERLMIAAAVRRAIERGQPLGGLEVPLRARFATSHAEAVAAIVAAAAEPVTLEDLRLALDTIAPRLTTEPEAEPWTRLRAFFADLLVLRQADMPSPRPADRLRRARRALAEGNVEAAIAEIAHMPGVIHAQGWTGAASRYVNACKALDEIERAAAQAPPPPPKPKPAPEPAAI